MQDRDEIDRRNNNVSRVNHQLDNIPERLEQGEEVIAVEHSRDKRLCNCRIKENCPLENKCLSDNIVYEARVLVGNKKLSYIGSTATVFK